MKPGSTIFNLNPSGSHDIAPRDVPRKKKLKSVLLAGKIVVTVFWHKKGVVLVNFLPRGTTVN